MILSIFGPRRRSRRPSPAGAVSRLYIAPEVAQWSVGMPGRRHGNVGGAGHACGARAMTPGAAQKAGGGRGRDRDEILTCRFSWPGRCAWCGGRGGRSRTVSKFAREALQLASEGSQMRLKGGASVGARRCGRLGGAHRFSQHIPRTHGTSGRHPLAVRSLGSSDTSLTAPPAALRVRVRAVPAWGALSGWLLGELHTSKVARRHAQRCGRGRWTPAERRRWLQ